MDDIEVVVAHSERTTLRVGDMFLKVDADPARLEAEARAMAMAPIPTPRILWQQRSVLALATLPGRPLGRLGERESSSPAAWAAAGAVMRTMHEAPLPIRIGPSADQIAARLDDECRWLVENHVLPTELIIRNRRIADAALRPWTPKFMHGDLQIAHVFVDENDLAGYATDVDRDVIRAWWSARSLLASRWLIQHGFDPDSSGCEFDVLRTQG